MGNVESVLRSPDALPLPADVQAELRRALGWLRSAFADAESETFGGPQHAAGMALRAFAERRVARVEQVLAGLEESSRKKVRNALAGASADLDAAAGLLELADRAAIAAPIELSIASLAEQSLHVAWTIRARTADVRIQPAPEDCSVSCDPHVVARLLAIGVGIVHRVSQRVVVRTSVAGDVGTIEIAASGKDDASARLTQTRLVPSIEPTETVVRAAAAAARIGLAVEEARVVLTCPRVG